jgi:hypothetical protein
MGRAGDGRYVSGEGDRYRRPMVGRRRHAVPVCWHRDGESIRNRHDTSQRRREQARQDDTDAALASSHLHGFACVPVRGAVIAARHVIMGHGGRSHVRRHHRSHPNSLYSCPHRARLRTSRSGRMHRSQFIAPIWSFFGDRPTVLSEACSAFDSIGPSQPTRLERIKRSKAFNVSSLM